MQYQWYPGHMAKAKRQMQEDIKLIDVVVELVDARIPNSSKNPEIDTIAKGKSRVILLNKADMADPAVTALWKARYEKDGFFTFTKTLSNGLGLKWYAGTVENKTAPCDKNKNRVITLAEAYSYVRANASKLNQQMGSAHTQSCMYYGNKDYALFRMK